MWSSPLWVLESPLMMLGPGWNEVPWEGSDFNLLRERVCTSLSINTWGLDWTHLKSLAVNERDCEVTRLYRAIIICLGVDPVGRNDWECAKCSVQLYTIRPELFRLTVTSVIARWEGAIEPKQAPRGWSRWSMHRLISPSVQYLTTLTSQLCVCLTRWKTAAKHCI